MAKERIFFALALSAFGLLALSLLLLFQPPLSLTSPSQLISLNPNQRIAVTGTVVRESSFSNTRVIILDSGFELRCSSCINSPPFKGLSVKSTASLQRFNNKEWLQVHSLKYYD